MALRAFYGHIRTRAKMGKIKAQPFAAVSQCNNVIMYECNNVIPKEEN